MSITLDPTAFEEEAVIDAVEKIIRYGIISGPIGRLDDDNHRWYIDPANSELIYESITTIIGDTTNKPALVKWASNVAAECAVQNIDEVIRLMAEEGTEAAVKFLKLESTRLRELASGMGTYQHDVLESLILDSPIPDVPEELRGIEIDGEKVDLDVISDGLLNFFTDFGPEHLMAEATVVNTLHMLGGTLDYMGAFPKLRETIKALFGIDKIKPVGIGDLKTGKNLYEKAIREQLNAYFRCDEVWLDHLGNKMEMPEVDFLFVLHLRKSYERGYKFRLVPICEKAWLRFLNRREVIRDGSGDTKFVGTVLYPPLPDGSQPPPMIEDVATLSRCAKKLIAAGLTMMVDLSTMTRNDLSSVNGVGPKALEAIEEVLIAHGLSFASETVSISIGDEN